MAFLAVRSIIEYDYRTAFFWLWLQVVVDATDGTLARRFRVAERLPWFSGTKLDDVIDYLTYVFVPALCVWRGLVVPDAWAMPVASAMLLSSAYGFSRTDSKTPDHFFTGFPSYWNIVVWYLLVAGWPSKANAAILMTLSVLVFVPIRYIYPSRTPVWQLATNTLGLIWAVLVLLMLWEYPVVPPVVFWMSLVFPAYYVGLSLALQVYGREGSRSLRRRRSES